MRIGLIGPAIDGEEGALQQAAEFLLVDASADQVIYLASDAVVRRVVRSWANALPDRESKRLDLIRRLPEPPARAIEMLDDWIMMAIHDKATLDDEDLANAHLFVYGLGDDAALTQVGARHYFTPGRLTQGKVGLVETLGKGKLGISVFEYAGTPLWSKVLQSGGPKLTVTD